MTRYKDMKSDVCNKYVIFVKFRVQFMLSLTSSQDKSFYIKNKIKDQLPVLTFISLLKQRLTMVNFISYNFLLLTDMTE